MADDIIPAADLPVAIPGTSDYVVGVQLGNNRQFKIDTLPLGSMATAQLDAAVADAEAARDAAAASAQTAELAASSGPVAGYETKALLDADLAHDEGALALVTNDSIAANNGTYRKEGASGAGSWVLSADRVTGLEGRMSAAETDADVAHGAIDTMAEQVTDPLSTNTNMPGMALAIVDDLDQLGFGLSLSGERVTREAAEGEMSDSNSLGLLYGISDEDGNSAFGIRRDGGLVLASGDEGPLGENNLGLVWAVADEDGNVALGVKEDGTLFGEPAGLYAPLAGTPYESSGDIHLVQGAEVIQLTHTGDNSAPHIHGQAVRFLSTRRRGEIAEYQTTGVDAEVRAYADTGLYEQVIITGQSLAAGSENPAQTTTPPYPSNAFKFTNGPVGNASETIVGTIAPLAEATNETISTGFAAKLLSKGLDRTLLVCGQAWGGKAYADIKKGGTTDVYADCITQVGYGAALSGGAGVRAVFVIHGEADGIAGNTGYADDLDEWLDDFTADIKTANSQHEPVVMLLCQTSSAAGYTNDAARDTFVTPFLQLAASESNPRIFMVGPKYHLTYIDHAHIDGDSTRLWGEYYAKVYRRVVIEGEDWKPVSPSAVNVVGSDVVIDFHVPEGPLVLDTTLVTNPGDYGFVLKNGGGVTITGVALTGDAQVTVSLSGSPPPGAVLSYAFHNGTYTTSGWNTGARGCIRDSDSELSVYTSAPLYNWCAAFKHTF